MVPTTYRQGLPAYLGRDMMPEPTSVGNGFQFINVETGLGRDGVKMTCHKLEYGPFKELVGVDIVHCFDRNTGNLCFGVPYVEVMMNMRFVSLSRMSLTADGKRPEL